MAKGPNDPRVREKPNFPYIEFVKVKRFNSGDNTTPEEIAVPVILDARTAHIEPTALAEYRKQSRATLVGYGNLEAPRYKSLKAQLDNELNQSSAVKEYMSAMQSKVEKAKENAKAK